jgi:hypothetical protein
MFGAVLYLLDDYSQSTISFLDKIENSLETINQYFKITFSVINVKSMRTTQEKLRRDGIESLPALRFYRITDESFFYSLVIAGSRNIINALTFRAKETIDHLSKEDQPVVSSMVNPRNAVDMIEEYQRKNLYEIDDETGNIITDKLDDDDNPDAVSEKLRQLAQNPNLKAKMDEKLSKDIRDSIDRNPKMYKRGREVTRTQRKIISAARERGVDVEKVRYGNNDPHSNANQKSVSFPARNEMERERGATEERDFPEDKEILRTYQQNAQYDDSSYYDIMQQELLKK